LHIWIADMSFHDAGILDDWDKPRDGISVPLACSSGVRFDCSKYPLACAGTNLCDYWIPVLPLARQTGMTK
jgi:hypothetical protein